MTDFRIRVIVDPTGAETGARRVEQQLDNVGSAATRVQGLIARAFAFTGVAVGLTGAINTIANFEQSMSTVRAVSSATEEQFRSLRDEAVRLGSTTRFSASEAAEGMKFLAQAGFTVDQVMASVGDTLLLAQAGALDLGSAADIASNVLTGFRLKAEEAGRVVDVLAFAANAGNTDVRQLGEAMKFVAPVAAGLGVSLEEATSAVTALSDAGLQGSLAGTGLRRVLAELESPSAKTVEILNSIGVAASEVRVSQVGLTTALKRLADAGLDTAGALEVFGDRGGPAFEVLSAAIPRVQDLTKALENAGGTAERIALIMDDNLKGALLNVESAYEGFILALGEAGASNALGLVFATVSESLRVLAGNIDTVIALVEALAIVLSARLVQAFVTSIAAAVGQMVALEFALGATTVKAALLSVALKGVQGVLIGIAANPVTAIALAVGAVVVGLTLMESQTERVERITGTLETAVTRVKEAYVTANGELDKIAQTIEGLTLSEALQQQAEASQLLEEQTAYLVTRLYALSNVLSRQQGFERTGMVVEVENLMEALHRGEVSIDDVVAALDRFGQAQAGTEAGEFINEVIGVAREAETMEEKVASAEAIIRLLSGTATEADAALLGLGDGAVTAAGDVDVLAGAAINAISALRQLQNFIPELARAGKVADQLAAAQAAYNQGLADINNNPDLNGLDRISELQTLTDTYNRARSEIDGTAAATREADAALQDYTDSAAIGALEGQARAAEVARREYEALTAQLTAAGAGTDELAAAEAAYQQQLANIERDFAATDGGSDGGGGGRHERRQREIMDLQAIIGLLDDERAALLLSNDERDREVRLQELVQQATRDGISLSQAEIALIEQKIEANQRFENAIKVVGAATNAVFSRVDDAFDEFIRTGKVDFRDFANDIILELARIARQALIIKPLLGLANGFLGNVAGGGGIGGALLGALGGGFQTGGSVVAGGSGGPDSQLFVTRVSPGERIDFTPEGEGSGGGGKGTTINFNISTPDVAGFKRSQSQLAAQAARLIGSGKRNM